MIEIDPAALITAYDDVTLKHCVAGVFEGPVDLADRESLKPYLRSTVTSDAIYAF